MVLAPCWKYLPVHVRIYFWALYSIPSIYISFFIPIPYCFDYCGCMISFKIRKCESSSSVLFFSGCFGFLGVFDIQHTDFCIYSRMSLYQRSLYLPMGSTYCLKLFRFNFKDLFLLFFCERGLWLGTLSDFVYLEMSSFFNFTLKNEAQFCLL